MQFETSHYEGACLAIRKSPRVEDEMETESISGGGHIEQRAISQLNISIHVENSHHERRDGTKETQKDNMAVIVSVCRVECEVPVCVLRLASPFVL